MYVMSGGGRYICDVRGWMIYAMSGADDICDVRGQMIYVMSGGV